MRNVNVECECNKIIDHIELVSIKMILFVRIRMRTVNMHLMVGPNANVLSDGKSLHTQGHCRVAHASHRENYTGPLITFVIHIRRSYSHYTQVES